MTTSIALIPTRRRIGSSHTTFIYDGGILMIETVTGAIAGLRTTLNLIRTAVDARDDRLIREALSSINDRIISIQDACMRLQETNATLLQDKHTLANDKRELENELLQLTQQANQLAQYERFHTPVGTVVYIDKTTQDSPDGAVYVCPSCMDEGKTSTLQPQYQGKMLVCSVHGKFGFDIEPTSGPFSGRPK